MGLIVRVLGLSLLTAALGAGLGLVLFQQDTYYQLPAFVLGCLGCVVGVVAGAAGEIVAAVRERS